MISSACRLTSTPTIAVTKANSATKSRAAVPSIEFGVDPVKPRSFATASGSRPRLEPASAPAPYGESAATRASQSRSRATSRTSGQAWAIRWWLSSTGWACWRWVRPGMIAPRCCSAWSAIASARSSTIPAMTWAWSRRNTLNSVAIWSLRLRPARSLPPRSGPTRSTSASSRAPCTSSSDSRGSSSPERTCRSSSSMPAMSSSSSAWLRWPAALQNAGVRPGTVEVVARQPPVEVGAAREVHELGTRAPLEATAPERTGVGAAVLGHGAFRSRFRWVVVSRRSFLAPQPPSTGG